MKRRGFLTALFAIPAAVKAQVALRLYKPYISTWNSDTATMVLSDGTRMTVSHINYETQWLDYSYTVSFTDAYGKVFHQYIEFHEPGWIGEPYSLLWRAYKAVYGEPV